MVQSFDYINESGSLILNYHPYLKYTTSYQLSYLTSPSLSPAICSTLNMDSRKADTTPNVSETDLQLAERAEREERYNGNEPNILSHSRNDAHDTS